MMLDKKEEEEEEEWREGREVYIFIYSKKETKKRIKSKQTTQTRTFC